jgi:hypothetical protein
MKGNASEILFEKKCITNQSSNITENGLDKISQSLESKAKKISFFHFEITPILFPVFFNMNYENIEELDLSRGNLNSKCCKYLSKTPMNNLKKLSLNANEIGAAGVLHLSKKPFPSCEKIDLRFNYIPDFANPYIVRTNSGDLLLMLDPQDREPLHKQKRHRDFLTSEKITLYDPLCSTQDKSFFEKKQPPFNNDHLKKFLY